MSTKGNSWEPEQELVDESRMAKMFRKIKADPAVPIGMAGWTGLVGYGLYNVRNRKTSLSLYLISLRVKAQAFAIGCMTVAVVYNIGKHAMKNKNSDNPNN